jgi:hypothetical protein
MSPDGDQIVFENSIANNTEPVPFSEKKYNFITDSTSNGGNFQSGQINFDLSTFSSQNWVSLTEAVVEIPLKITAKLTTAAVGTPGNTSANIFTTICKNGFHQWINSAQLLINGQNIQSQQPYENVAASYRILSTWSQDTLNKWGDACGIAIDDCSANSDVASSYSIDSGITNVVYTDVANNVRGFDSTNYQNKIVNKGTINRAQLLNANALGTTVAGKLLSVSGMKNAGKSNVASATASNIAGTTLYSQFIMATIRVRDLFDINEFPLVKNIKGYMYLTFNSTEISLTGNSGGTDVASVNITPQTGNSCPVTVVIEDTAGINFGGGSTTQPTVTITATVSGNPDNAVGSSGPLLSNARLVMPYYEANPNIDNSLKKVQEFKTLEKIVNPFIIPKGQVVNVTLTVGVPNPRKLVLLPMWQNLGGASLANPELSAFDQTPATSGPYAKLDNLQVYVANKPLYQYPIQYDYEAYITNNIGEGANAGLVDEMSSGLLSKSLFETNHRFYTIDLSRRQESDDGMSRSVQITATNSSTEFGMKVIAILFYEKKFQINTATCQIQSA